MSKVQQIRFAHNLDKEPENESKYTSPLNLLICAIAKRAVDDYLWMVERGTVQYQQQKKNAVTMQELTQFFCGGWFETLTGIQGDKFLQRLSELDLKSADVREV